MPDIQAMQSMFATNPRLKALLQQVIKGMGAFVPSPKSSPTPHYEPVKTTRVAGRAPQEGVSQEGPRIQVRQLHRGGGGRAPSPEEKHRRSMGPIGGSRVLPGPGGGGGAMGLGGAGQPQTTSMMPDPEAEARYYAAAGTSKSPGEIQEKLTAAGTVEGPGVYYGPKSPYALQFKERERQLAAQRLQEIEAKGEGGVTKANLAYQQATDVANINQQGRLGAAQIAADAKNQPAPGMEGIDPTLYNIWQKAEATNARRLEPQSLTRADIIAIKDMVSKIEREDDKKKKKKKGEGGEGGGGGGE